MTGIRRLLAGLASTIAVVSCAVVANAVVATPAAAAAALTGERLNSHALHQLRDILTQRSQDSFAGMSVDSATGAAVLHVKAGTDLAGLVRLANGSVTALRQKGIVATIDDPARFSLTVRKVKRSLAELNRVRERAARETWTRDVASRIAVDWIDPATNQVVVGLTTLSDQDRAAAEASFGADAVRLIQRERPQKASRVDDSPAWWGGIQITGPCSTGFTVTRFGGVRYMLTSGHCGPYGTNFYNLSEWVGSTQFIDYTSGGYDTALIGGSSYGSSIYTGCPECGDRLPVKGLSFPLVGNYVCLSGSRTGRYCTTYLEVENICVTYVDKLRTCHLNSARSSNPSKSGAQKGDSGGPVYREGSGGALAVGIIDGTSIGIAYYTPIDTLLSRWSALLVLG